MISEVKHYARSEIHSYLRGFETKDRRGPLCGYEVPVSGMPSGEILICNYAGAGESGILKPFEARVIRE